MGSDWTPGSWVAPGSGACTLGWPVWRVGAWYPYTAAAGPASCRVGRTWRRAPLVGPTNVE